MQTRRWQTLKTKQKKNTIRGEAVEKSEKETKRGEAKATTWGSQETRTSRLSKETAGWNDQDAEHTAASLLFSVSTHTQRQGRAQPHKLKGAKDARKKCI